MNMERTKFQIKMLSCCFFAGGLLLAGCSTDDSIDVGEVDTTIGVNLNDFTIPLGKSEDITIDDLLKLKDDDCIQFIKSDGAGNYIMVNNQRVAINTGNVGDYLFYKKGDDVEPGKPHVDAIDITGSADNNINPKIGPNVTPAGLEYLNIGDEIPGTSGAIKVRLNAFDYNADKPDDVVSLETAGVDGQMTLNLSFNTNMQGFLKKFDTFDIEFPDYMTPQSATFGTLEGNILKLGTLNTNRSYVTTVVVKQLKFETIDAQNKLAIEDGKIKMLGDVNVSVSYGNLVKGSGDITDMHINSTVDIGTVKLTSATGKFDPAIDIKDSEFKIDDVPDFMDDPEVNILLDDPQLTLLVNSDVDLDATIDGTLTAYFSDNTQTEVKVNNIVIPRNKNSKILICRQPKAEPYQDYTQVVPVSNLSDLIRRIPDKILFHADAQVDKNASGTIQLGRDYHISTAYDFKAPLALQNNSVIVYDDKTDGFYKDIVDNDIDFYGETKLVLTGEILNNTPLKLDLVPMAIDVNGNVLTTIQAVSDNVIESSLTDNTPKKLSITLTKPANIDLKDVKFDGIKYKAKATSVNAATLNKDNHKIKIDNLKISISGKASFDPDSKKD